VVVQKPLTSPDVASVAPVRNGVAATVRALLRTLRPKQWAKNGLLYLALLFTINQYWDPTNLAQLLTLVGRVTVGVLLFSAVSSAVYVLNDLRDIEQDRAHPRKRFRPLPAGLISPRLAGVTAAVIATVALVLSLILSPPFFAIVLIYGVIQIAYSYKLKHVVILDVFTIASGFVLRTVAGALIIGVPVSPWLYLCTILGALFLGFAKRRQEIVLLQEGASEHRRILEEYSPQLLDEILAVITSSTVMAYALYTFTAENLPKNHAMMATIPFVLYGIFRYLYLIHHRQLGGSPEEVLFSDRPLIATIGLWGLTVAGILMWFRNV
jgi:4-hydroxybenzoate polyprenyltransferase